MSRVLNAHVYAGMCVCVCVSPLQVTEAQRWALLEYIAHLSTRDWEALAFDLQVLGFIPPDVDPRERGLVEPLGRIMSQLVSYTTAFLCVCLCLCVKTDACACESACVRQVCEDVSWFDGVTKVLHLAVGKGALTLTCIPKCVCMCVCVSHTGGWRRCCQGEHRQGHHRVRTAGRNVPVSDPCVLRAHSQVSSHG